MAVAQKMTFADVLALPEDGRRFELIDGELIVAASPATRHQRASKRLGHMLYDAERAGLGEVLYAPYDVKFDDENVVEPDLIFVAADRQAVILEERIEGVPDILVEILSCSTASIDRGRGRRGKLRTYERFGVPYYWIVNVDHKRIAEYRLQDGRYPVEPAIWLPGDQVPCPPLGAVAIDVADVFRAP